MADQISPFLKTWTPEGEADVIAIQGGRGTLARETEAKVALELHHALKSRFQDYSVEVGRSLLYKIEIDPAGAITHESLRIPSRGQYAFQIDLLISKGSTPLVAIELKSGAFSSHDVITYSWKAGRHKQIYPYLRYGFVVVGVEMLGRRFVTHNEAFDFALALPSVAKFENDLIPILRRQVASAERLVEMMRHSRIKLRRYEEIVEMDL